jgi:hypothetical protein
MRTIMTVLAAGVLLIGSAGADELTRSVTDVTTITDGQGSSRILFCLGSVIDVEDIAIRKAVLHFRGSAAGERTVPLLVHPVTTSWSPGAVGWSTGWSREGGDYDEAVYARVEADLSSSSEVRIDVTSLMKEVLEAGLETDGFILTVDPREGMGIASGDMSSFSGLSSAMLEMTYRKSPPVLGQRGARAKARGERSAG